MKLTKEEKADRYDSLVYAISLQKDSTQQRLKEIDKEIDKSNGSVAAMLIGRKYAYMEFVEAMERWC